MTTSIGRPNKVLDNIGSYLKAVMVCPSSRVWRRSFEERQEVRSEERGARSKERARSGSSLSLRQTLANKITFTQARARCFLKPIYVGGKSSAW